jgi:hypothetical protein
MGYTTEFTGHFDVSPPLSEAHKKYLEKFSDTRRMRRNVVLLQADEVAEEAGLLPGKEGEYYVVEEDPGEWRNHKDESIINYNSPPSSQPSLWCQWAPNKDGTAIEWDGMEKFYCYVEWIEYIIDNFIKRWDYKLNGVVKWEGEDRDDMGKIVIENNEVSIFYGEITYKKIK